MKKPFNSKDFVFRPTTLSAALFRAGVTGKTHMVREQAIVRPVRTNGGRV